MIIKSMARKAPTFDQLIGYITRSAETGSQSFARNLYHGGEDEQLVARQFIENHRHLPRRMNGNALYHEVIVLEQNDRAAKARQRQILLDLAERYCQLRAPDQLAWGRVHFDTEYPHIHLMISANAVGSSRRVRLDKTSFAKIQAEVERFKAQRFPELGSRAVYVRSSDRAAGKTSRKEGEVTRRTGAPSKRLHLRSTLVDIFARAQDARDLAARIDRAGLALYQRGKTPGVVILETGRKHRLNTLGLEADYRRLMTQFIQKTSPSKPTPHTDPRAQDLLARREALERSAREELDRFDRDQER